MIEISQELIFADLAKNCEIRQI